MIAYSFRGSMMCTLRVVMTLFIGVLLLTAPTVAHPLGNFTINHLSKITVFSNRIEVRYILDLAEIPSYAALRAVSPKATMTEKQLAVWADAQTRIIVPTLSLKANGRTLQLILDHGAARIHQGAGGLSLLYLVMNAHAALPTGSIVEKITYKDASYPDRIGWKDVVLAPGLDPTRELTKYPNDLAGSPRRTTEISVFRRAGKLIVTTNQPAHDKNDVSSAGVARADVLSNMLSHGVGDTGFMLATLLFAVGLGALHALEPGHGKTLLAVSLVGARATVRQACVLGASVTIAHTAGVVALGCAIILFKGSFVPETIYPWITLISGIAIAVIGARALGRGIATSFEHHHDHRAVHDSSHTHDHTVPGTAPLTFGGTIWAAMSGGIAPCPAAIVVLLAAVALHQVAYGLIVILAFSLGLAATLTGLGIAVVRGAAWLRGQAKLDGFMRYGPLLSASIMSLIGAAMLTQGTIAQGVQLPAPVITAIVLLAVIGYAFSHPFEHSHAHAQETP
jgi:nickel/cobalt exporter